MPRNLLQDDPSKPIYLGVDASQSKLLAALSEQEGAEHPVVITHAPNRDSNDLIIGHQRYQFDRSAYKTYRYGQSVGHVLASSLTEGAHIFELRPPSPRTVTSLLPGAARAFHVRRLPEAEILGPNGEAIETLQQNLDRVIYKAAPAIAYMAGTAVRLHELSGLPEGGFRKEHRISEGEGVRLPGVSFVTPHFADLLNRPGVMDMAQEKELLWQVWRVGYDASSKCHSPVDFLIPSYLGKQVKAGDAGSLARPANVVVQATKRAMVVAHALDPDVYALLTHPLRVAAGRLPTDAAYLRPASEQAAWECGIDWTIPRELQFAGARNNPLEYGPGGLQPE